MCWTMGTGLQNDEGGLEDQLRRKLAAAVRSVQWTYAIFWSISATQEGVLVWTEGYYNGDIKTRKTVQPMELNADQIGLERSEQLRELYHSLSTGDSHQQAKRPSAALSPEDLTDLEWYYLVCMSFTFNTGQGLPGRALINGQQIWLVNADNAETKIFSRSLLAKSASVQTVACFPLTDGVLELGVHELVAEDASLIQQVITTFVEFPKYVALERSTSSPRKIDEVEQPTGMEVDRGIHKSLPECSLQPEVDPSVVPSHQSISLKEELAYDQDLPGEMNTNGIKSGSSADGSNGCGVNPNTEDSLMVGGLNGSCQVQSWQCMDDDFSNVHSSDCISQSFGNIEKAASCAKGNNVLVEELQECNHTKFNFLDPESSDSHYTKAIAAVLRNSYPSIVTPSFCSPSLTSCFLSWRKNSDSQKLPISSNTSQKMLKKILFEVPWMQVGRFSESQNEIGAAGRSCNLERNNYSWNNVLFERKRREKLNENFMILNSIVPSISKVDQESVLADTIEYLKDLERRIKELEACKEPSESESRERRQHPDTVERTSDNYRDNAIRERKTTVNKRKAPDIDEANAELNWFLSKDGLADMEVTIADKEVSVEMKCPWRECLLIEIVEALSNLHLDVHNVNSSTTDGTLMLNLKCKFRGAAVASAGMIKQTLQSVMCKF